MTTPNTNIQLNSLDPDVLKSNFITWLQTQSVFRDYNFVGSNMNVELDVLARNTFLNSFFLNMSFSEGFNDSAQLRDSLVSKSKEFNYLPYSMTSSTTSLNVNLLTANLTYCEIPKGTIFSGQNSNGSFYFVTDQNYISTSANNLFQFSNVNIYEGFYTSDLFSVDNSIPNQLFTLSNPQVDISSLSIVVSENSGSTNTIFVPAPNLYGLNGNSKVYFIQGASGNNYQFQFGDGVLGYVPQNGAIVSASYRVTSGDAANFVSTFNLTTNLSNFNGGTVSGSTIAASSVSSGGSQNESIDSIRFNNPRHYQTQGNAITGPDYKDLILANFPSVKDVNIYSGGITPTAIQFGIVFVAAISKSGNPLTTIMKNEIITFLRNKNILNIPVQMVDPDYLYINVNSNVHVDFTQTLVSENDYETLVSNTISLFSNNNIEEFDAPFRFSNLTDKIDNSDPSIISNETSISLTKFANVILNSNNSVVINYNNPIVSVNSSSIIISGNSYTMSDLSGILYLNQYSANNSVVNSSSIGTVNYSNGIVSISSLYISEFPNNSSGLSFTAIPKNKDIYAVGNDILEINPLTANINIVSN